MTAITALRHPLAALHLTQRRRDEATPRQSDLATEVFVPTSAVVPNGTSRFSPADCRLSDFREIVEQATDPTRVPNAARIERNVPIYPAGVARGLTPEAREALQAELAEALLEGPGIVVFEGAFEDLSIVDQATSAFEHLIARQKAAGAASGDHFAAPGANDRVWGALDKLALSRPEVFADYYANDVIALISEAWLGPNYQVTSQVNVVKPGGVAQTAHRDYHLGFMSGRQAAQYPAQVHRLSPTLTLQGAVAHCDMPIESGPTMYLPHSQKYAAGYVAFHSPEFRAYFEENYTQLPLSAGDAVFFNPALFHAAGTNQTMHIKRMANLLQVSSAFGRAMESVDRSAMCRALFPVLARRRDAGASVQWLRNVVAASAEGYPFPTNLDRDQPVDGMAPQSQADLVWQALQDGWDTGRLVVALSAQDTRRGAAAASL